MDYAVPYNYGRTTGDFLTGRGSARHQPTCNNLARPIADIFVPTGDIGDRGQGKEREGRGKHLQGPAEGGGERNSVGRTERGRMGVPPID